MRSIWLTLVLTACRAIACCLAATAISDTTRSVSPTCARMCSSADPAPLTMVTRPCCFDTCIEGEQICLKRNFVDHGDNLADLRRRPMNTVHCAHCAAYDLTAGADFELCLGDDVVCFAGCDRALVDGRGYLLQRGRGALQVFRLPIGSL